jgi:hypothetical protein
LVVIVVGGMDGREKGLLAKVINSYLSRSQK